MVSGDPQTEYKPGAEFHDSRVAEVETTAVSVMVPLAPACVHRSSGAPKIAAGTVGVQDAIMTFRGSRFPGSVPQLPAKIADGEVNS
jgi:hypothetical protein